MKVTYTITRDEIKQRGYKIKVHKPRQHDELNFQPLQPVLVAALKKKDKS